MHKTLSPRDDVNRLYLKKREWTIEIISIKKCIDFVMNRLDNFIKQNCSTNCSKTNELLIMMALIYNRIENKIKTR